MNDPRIFKLLQKLERNVNRPDLHSFKAQIKDGVVFVEAHSGGIYIELADNNNKCSQWVGSCIAAANRLEMLDLDLDTVEIWG